MKNKIFLATLIAAFVFGLTSCSDFLNEDPKGVLSPDSFFSTQNDLDMSVYAMMFQVQSYQCNSNPILIDCQGDDVTSTTGSNKAAYLSADGFEVPSDLKGINGTWNSMYAIIKAANQIIMYADKTPTTKEEINIAKGQAFFWRAFAYFNLVRNYGPVILNLDNVPDDNKSPLSSVADVYAQIEKDLLAADACNMPAKYSAAPRNISGANAYITGQAVKAALAAVYMHMAGWPLNLTAKYADAAKYAKEVIDGVKSGKYSQNVLAWDQVYNYGNNYNDGCMVGIYYSTAQMGWWSNSDSQLSSCHQSGKLWGGWGDFLAERKFWAEFPDGPRKNYVYSNGVLLDEAAGGKDADGNYALVDWWATADEQPFDAAKGNNIVPDYRPIFIGYSINKNESGSLIAEPFDANLPVWPGMCLAKTHQLLRYSEVLCWYAEAVGRGGSSDIAGAQDALRQVVSKAYSDQAEIDRICALTGDALAEQAWKEHGWEVAGNTVGMVTRRSDELRMNKLKAAWEYRNGAQDYVLVPKGTVTRSAKITVVDGKKQFVPYTYTLNYDVKVKEEYPVASQWNDDKSIYQIYPPTETAKNPVLVR